MMIRDRENLTVMLLLIPKRVLLFIFLPALIRTGYSQSGSLDNTFGTGGIVTSTIHSNVNVGNGHIIKPDGKIVSVGFTYVGFYNTVALLGYNSDGSVDSSFGTNGI